MMPEFGRPERIDTIGAHERQIRIEADTEERAALARRFGLVGVDRLAASFAVRREGETVIATGRVEATVVQACSATGEPLTAAIDEAVALRFVAEAPNDGEVELSADALDTLPIEEGAMIDLGEAAAETMALALDPFPRSPAAAAALREAGVLEEGEAGPLGALSGLKAMLAGKG